MAGVTDEGVARFVETTGCDADQATFLLEATHGNFEAAVQMYYESHPSAHVAAGTHGTARAAATTPAAAAAAPAGRPAGQAAAARQRRGPGLLALPIKMLTAGINLMASVVHMTFSIAALVGDRVLPPAVMRGARGIVRSVLAATGEPPDAPAQAREFVADFKAQYGDAHPAWLEESWRQAASLAHQQFKFLFAFLHSPEHEDSEGFVREVLCAPSIVSYVGETFVAWGGDVRRPDAFGLSTRLNVSTYPCIALLAFSGQRTKLVALVQGRVRAPELLAALRRAVDEQGMLLMAEQLEQEEREMSRRLLAEQNAEYEASLAADQEREARRQEEARKAQEAAQQQAAEEARQRAEEEAAEQRRLQAAANIAARRQQKAALLPEEPAAGTAGIATIRVRLPDGKNCQRRFGPDTTVQVLYDWVDSLEGFDSLSYSLVSAFPKRVFGGDSRGQSLEAAGLVPQGALFVQDSSTVEGSSGVNSPRAQRHAKRGLTIYNVG
uniref:UBX domain-containing protein n=1 Tax=Tetradesmus obliquus TaxID=3088 RepID=A0A383V860_TETOB|eukprot:jgi/Sobl393_1/12526/SZX60764.1